LPYKKAVNELDKLELCEALKRKLLAEIAVWVYYLED
jgi:hypothetical protein